MLLKMLLLSKETELQKVVLNKKRFNTSDKYNHNLDFEQNCSKKSYGLFSLYINGWWKGVTETPKNLLSKRTEK